MTRLTGIGFLTTTPSSISDVRAFCHTMNEQNAVAGVFITLEPVTRGVRQIAANMGDFEIENNKHYPRLQFWQYTL